MTSTSPIAPPSLPLVPPQEEQMLRETVRSICLGFGPHYTRDLIEDDQPPIELWDALASRGYLGVNIPEEYDGGGLGMSALAAVGEEISAAGVGLILIVVSPAIVGSILTRHGTPEQKERWLRGIATGTTKVAFAITEPDAGSNSHNLSTAARKTGRGWALRGQKTYISGVEEANAILVVARKREESGQLGLPLLMIVDADAPGMTKTHIPTAEPGANKQWQLFFDDVEVPGDRLVGSETAGLKAAFDGLNPERIMGATVCNGGARRAPGAAPGGATGAGAGLGVRARAGRVGRSDRLAPGHLAPARAGEDRAGAGAPDDVQGARALRRRAARRRGEQHGQVRGRRGGDSLCRPGDPDA